MKYRIKWQRNDSSGYGPYVYDSEETANKVIEELNRKKGSTTYTVVEAE